MRQKFIQMSILVAVTVSFACIAAGAVNITINLFGASPFQYQGYSYLPLNSVSDFLDAPLRWDSGRHQTVFIYNGMVLILTSGSRYATYDGRRIILLSPPVVWRGRTYISTEVFKKYYHIPMEWDRNRSEVRIKGPNGWGKVNVVSHAPWHGGPPPWAPAWGQRNKSKSQWQKSHNMSSMDQHPQGKSKHQSNQKGKSQLQRSNNAPSIDQHTKGKGKVQSNQKNKSKGK